MLSDETRARIQKLVDDNKILLFMKGNAQQPRCGFSARAVGVLDELGQTYKTVDVLQDPEIRAGIKVFSEWPTIPQLYVDKEFIGGSDIISQMANNGELHEMLGIDFVEPTPPTIHLTPAMVEAFRRFGASSPGALPRLEVSPRFQYNLAFDRQRDSDFVVEAGGIRILIDRSSARRADGIKLDYEANSTGGGGVNIDNPNEPPGVEQIDVFQLKGMLARGEVTLFDVRTPHEREIASLPQAKPFDPAALAALSKDTPIAFLCHHGGRSQQAAQHFLDQGYTKVFNVSGGIDAWSLNIDKAVPRY